MLIWVGAAMVAVATLAWSNIAIRTWRI